MGNIDHFKKRRDEIEGLRQLARTERTEAMAFQMWRDRTKRLLNDTFGWDSEESKRFREMSFTPFLGPMTASMPDPDEVEPFLSGCDRAQAFLDAIIADMEDGRIADAQQAAPDANERVARILERFHGVACQLRHRPRDRAPLLLKDEYDVHYVLHALLQVDFDDVRPEEPTPSSAGGGSRLDFLLKGEGIVVEVKMTREKLTDAKLREELGADITHYAAHPDCRALYCFVYDPDHLVRQPAAFERDLSVPRNDMPVTVLVRPRA